MNHGLCLLEVFRGDKENFEKNCQVKIFINAVLLQAISIYDGVWVVATHIQIDISRVCGGDPCVQ